MTPDARYPERVPRRYVDGSGWARDVRAAQRRRYASRGPAQSTKAMTLKLTALAVVATLLIGGVIAAQMAAGNDPALGPKAAARAKKASAKRSGNGSGTSSGGGSGTDPYSQAYGDDGYYSGSGSSSSGSSSGSGSSGYSTQQSSPAPVTSGTS